MKRILGAIVLLAVMAIVLPILNYAPKLYSWLLRAHLRRLYRRLRAVETEMQTELTAPRVLALQTDIVSIGRAAHILPVRHSDLFFALRLHIDQTRARLAARLVELRNQTRKR